MAILHGTGWLICIEKESPDDYAKHYHYRRSVIESIFNNEEEDAIFSKVKDIS